MKIEGICPSCGHKETRETDKSEQWLINRPIWTWCHGNRLVSATGHLSGIIFSEVKINK